MEISDKKLKRRVKIIYTAISLVLAIFLILLSSVIIDDLDSAVEYPYSTDYEDKEQTELYATIGSELDVQISELYGVQENINKMTEIALRNKEAEQESFDNWIKTRTTLGTPAQDTEVLKRVNKLDDYQAVVQAWKSKSDSIQKSIDILYLEKSNNEKIKQELRNESYAQYEIALRAYNLHVFLIRLLFVAPILLLGIYFFLKKRKSKLAPIYNGFSLFSLYVFFVGLVPYLPSYGGYIRYVVGVVLTLGLGYYGIIRIRAYSDKKKAELAESSQKRASKLQGEIAEGAFNKHVCPSCGKDFLLKPWENPIKNEHTHELQQISNYCRFCGLQVIKPCVKCKQNNYAHLPFCINCGDSLKDN